jgi:hypothetical protein
VGVLAEASGWCLIDRDPRAAGTAARVPSCVLRRADGEALSVTVYGADGAAADTGDSAAAARAARLAGRADGAVLLWRALTHVDARYSPATRLADACRALGVPLALIEPAAAPFALPDSPAAPFALPDSPAAPFALPDSPAAAPVTGVILVNAVVAAAAADAPLTRQSAWTVPFTPAWSLHLWDGQDTPSPVIRAAAALARRDRPTLACWWSPSPTEPAGGQPASAGSVPSDGQSGVAGFVLAGGGQPATGHEWGGQAPVSADSTARAARALAAAFGVPDQALTLTALLRRTNLAPAAALAELFAVLGMTTPGIGQPAGEVAAWAATVPGAVRTPRLGMVAGVRHAMGEAPPRNALDELSARRPRWYRVLQGAIAVVLGVATAALAVVWQDGGISGWFVLLGTAATATYAWGLRPARRRTY